VHLLGKAALAVGIDEHLQPRSRYAGLHVVDRSRPEAREWLLRRSPPALLP
jgi:hypothetical protein